jgi:adenylate cyclase, class 2
MSFSNIEIKARTGRLDFIRQYLIDQDAEYRGTDLQTDTYFNTTKGRLKLRQGNIENTLIFYQRDDCAGPKESVCSLMEIQEGERLKSILARAMETKAVVTKKREIYFIGNVKFHLDELSDLGKFVEIEASNKAHPFSLDMLRQQCDFYRNAFLIAAEDLVDISYSDMILTNRYAHLR